MKLTEIRPCDSCGGKIAPQFYVLRLSLAMFKPSAVNSTMGIAQITGSLAIAETLSPDPEVVTVMGDEDKRLWMELYLCPDCCMKDLNILGLIETQTTKARPVPADDDEQP